MKAHARRKAQRAAMHQLCADGYMNFADGSIKSRSLAKDDSMARDYYPQRGGKGKAKSSK